MLEVLAGLGLPFLREYVAVHPNVTSALLDGLVPGALATPNDVGLTRAITMNETTPASILGRILEMIGPERVDGSRRENGPYEELALRALAHANCPAAAAEQFIATRDLPRSFRVSLAQAVTSVRVLEMLSSDASEIVTAVAEERLRKLGERRESAPN
jgi:hypothetical protein